MSLFNKAPRLPAVGEALPGRSEAIAVPMTHHVLGTPMRPPFPGQDMVIFGLGCFWGAERKFWQAAGVTSTHVGYAGGSTGIRRTARCAPA